MLSEMWDLWRGGSVHMGLTSTIKETISWLELWSLRSYSNCFDEHEFFYFGSITKMQLRTNQSACSISKVSWTFSYIWLFYNVSWLSTSKIQLGLSLMDSDHIFYCRFFGSVSCTSTIREIWGSCWYCCWEGNRSNQ